MARNVSVAFVIALFGSGVALAGDPPGQAAEQVEVRLAVKAGDTFRFRQTEASSTEVDGKPYKAEESAQEYSVAVKSVRPDGGLDVALTFEAIRAKLLDRGTGAWTELDTSKPLPEGSAMKAQAMDALSRAMVGRPIAVTLDAHGVPTAVSGLRDAVSRPPCRRPPADRSSPVCVSPSLATTRWSPPALPASFPSLSHAADHRCRSPDWCPG